MIRLIPGFRGLPFPGDPTTELIAIFFLNKAKVLCEAIADQARPESLLLQETPTNSVKVFAESSHYAEKVAEFPNTGWWNSVEIENRKI